MQDLSPETETDSAELARLVRAYQGVATSTIGHITTAGYLPPLRAIALPDSEQVSHAGRVLSVTLASNDTEVIRRALLAAMPHDVLFIDARVLGVRACWGALRTCAAIYEQLAAVIVLGNITDSATLATLPMPVFATGISAVTTSGYHAHASSQDETRGRAAGQAGRLRDPIDYADVPIRTGDIAVMDADGVFVLEQELAAALLPTCQQKQAEDDNKLRLFLDAYQRQCLHELSE